MNYNIKGLIVNLNDKCKMYSVICPRGEMDPALKRAWVSIHKAENKINALPENLIDPKDIKFIHIIS